MAERGPGLVERDEEGPIGEAGDELVVGGVVAERVELEELAEAELGGRGGLELGEAAALVGDVGHGGPFRSGG
jgi:hypothetical protein